MSRLPVVDSDNNSWGTILNDFLAQAHNADGTLKSGAPSRDTRVLRITDDGNI